MRELAEFEFDIVDRGLDAWTPIVKHLRRFLEAINASTLGMLEVVEAAILLNVVLGEAFLELIDESLLHIIEDELDGGIHGACTLLKSGKVGMGREGLKDLVSYIRMLATRWDWRKKKRSRVGKRRRSEDRFNNSS